MAADLPAAIIRALRRADEHGHVVRRLIVVVDLPPAAPGSNARTVDSTHHLSFADVIADPGVLGAVAQFATRRADA